MGTILMNEWIVKKDGKRWPNLNQSLVRPSLIGSRKQNLLPKQVVDSLCSRSNKLECKKSCHEVFDYSAEYKEEEKKNTEILQSIPTPLQPNEARAFDISSPTPNPIQFQWKLAKVKLILLLFPHSSYSAIYYLHLL